MARSLEDDAECDDLGRGVVGRATRLSSIHEADSPAFGVGICTKYRAAHARRISTGLTIWLTFWWNEKHMHGF